MIGSVITATQAGYAIGLLFLVPLGDWLNRKYVVMSQLLLSVAALVAAGLSPNIVTLLGAMLIVGLMAVVVQVLVAWVAILATPQKRGQAVGTLTSGIVSGILLSRFISGAIADIAGWRAVYLTAACLMLMIAGIVWKIMPSPPQQPQPQKPTYLSLLKSVFQLYLTEPQLRKRGILALFIFAEMCIRDRSGLLFFAGTQDFYLRAFDTANGKEIWKSRLPVGSQSGPMTYVSPKTGKQYIIINAGGARQSPDRGD